MLKELNEYGIVAKVNVSNMRKSVAWYKNKLDFVVDKRYTNIASWRQLTAPGIANFFIGLNYNPSCVGTGGATTTILVKNIKLARKELLLKKVKVGKIINVGDGVLLASFFDLDHNALEFRQNVT